VTRLQTGVTYTFSVTVFNRAGLSRAAHSSARISVIAPSAPRSIQVIIANDVAQVSWTRPRSGGGSPISGYVVTALPGTLRCSTTEATHCAVTGLQSGVTYMFSVRVHNAEGQSRAAEARGVVLTLPTVAVNLGVAVASWTAPSWNGGAVAHYRFNLAPGTSTCSTLEVTTCTMVGVPTASHYRVTLALVSTSGRTLSTVTGVVREVALLQAYFDFDSYALSPAMRVKITNLAKVMAKNGVRALTIYGHTDGSGALGHNLALSRERAQAVASYLYEQLRLLGDTSVRIHVVAGGVSTLSTLYALDRNAIVVTSSHQVFALARSAP
jgi:hypothetical protein